MQPLPVSEGLYSPEEFHSMERCSLGQTPAHTPHPTQSPDCTTLETFSGILSPLLSDHAQQLPTLFATHEEEQPYQTGTCSQGSKKPQQLEPRANLQCRL